VIDGSAVLCVCSVCQCGISASPLQVLCGHHDSVTCVTIVTELDMAVSGAKVTSLSPDTYLSTLVIYDGVRLTLINFCSV